MKKILFYLLIPFVGFAQTWPNQNCNQIIQPQSITKYNSYVSNDNWQYFGSSSQTRVRVKFESITSSDPNSNNNILICGCPNNLIASQIVNTQVKVTVEAEYNNLIGNFRRRNTFKPNFELTFSNVSISDGKHSYKVSDGSMCGEVFSGLLATNGISNTNLFGAKATNGNGLPSNSSWNYLNPGKFTISNTNFSDLILYPSGSATVGGGNWFTHYPSLSGTITCRAWIGGQWRNLGTIIL
jgi:hypothetical protein